MKNKNIYDSINDIDFSNGIKSKDIQYSLNIIQKEIDKERLSVGGSGVFYGFNLNIDNLNIEVSEGGIIDNLGREFIVEEKVFEIKKVSTSIYKEILVIENDGTCCLNYIPYSKEFNLPLYKTNNYKEITIYDNDNLDEHIPFNSINRNKLYFDDKYKGRKIFVSYNKPYKDIFAIYLKDNNLFIAKDIQSSSPSFPEIDDKCSILFLIGLDPVTEIHGELLPTLSLLQNKVFIRNVFSDNTNNLYLKGELFEKNRLIHIKKCENPIENTIWYDADTNNLKVYRTIDDEGVWVDINKDNRMFVPYCEKKIYSPKENPDDRQTFIFDKIKDRNLIFTPNTNSLSILIEQIPLMNDQFTEIIERDSQNRFAPKGIGFKLIEPIDKKAYVEVTVNQRSIEAPLNRKIRRSSTFTEEYSVVIDTKNQPNVFITKCPFKFNCNELEIYLNGKKLAKDIEYHEGIDSFESFEKQNTKGDKFIILVPMKDKDILTYRVTTNIYTYNELFEFLEDFKNNVALKDDVFKEINKNRDLIDKTNTDLRNAKEDIDNKLSVIKKSIPDEKNLLKSNDKISKDNLSKDILSMLPKGIIDFSFQKTSDYMLINNITSKDFFIFIDTQNISGNNILKKNEDFLIEEVNNKSYVKFIRANSIENGNIIYVMGIKF